MKTGQALEAAFELGSSDERVLEEAAMILRRHIIHAEMSSSAALR